MAKAKDFKKPVNNEELIINEEDEKNKRLIVIICLSIVVVLGLIIASVSYFNSKSVEDDNKEKKNNNKPTEIIDKPVVDNKPVENPTTNVVERPSYSKPSKPVVVIPEEPEEDVAQVITNPSGNDYEVIMDGSTAKVSGVSRFVTLENGDTKTVIQLRVLLDSKYTKDDLEKDNLDNLVITTTVNGVTNNFTKYVVKEDPETGRLYFDWVQPVGNGEIKPRSFTIMYGDGSKDTYEVDLSGLKIETELDANDDVKVVVPEKTDSVVGIDLPYNVEIFKQLTSDQIEWQEEPTVMSNDTDVLLDDQTSTGVNTAQDPAGEQKPEDLTFTVKFTKGENYNDDYEINTDSIGSEVSGYGKVLVIKVYAPKKDGVSIDDAKVVITGTKPNGEKYTHTGAEYVGHDDDDPTNTFVYLYYAADPDKDVQVDPKPTFTIDWDGDGNDYGTYTYEFDITELMKEDTEDSTNPDVTDPDQGQNPDTGDTTGDSGTGDSAETNDNLDTAQADEGDMQESVSPDEMVSQSLDTVEVSNN